MRRLGGPPPAGRPTAATPLARVEDCGGPRLRADGSSRWMRPAPPRKVFDGSGRRRPLPPPLLARTPRLRRDPVGPSVPVVPRGSSSGAVRPPLRRRRPPAPGKEKIDFFSLSPAGAKGSARVAPGRPQAEVGPSRAVSGTPSNGQNSLRTHAAGLGPGRPGLDARSAPQPAGPRRSPPAAGFRQEGAKGAGRRRLRAPSPRHRPSLPRRSPTTAEGSRAPHPDPRGGGEGGGATWLILPVAYACLKD